jgi:hypothetical protein
VYWAVRGAAPNREFVVEWNNVPHYSNTGRATIQLILHEGSDNITFLYPDVNFGNTNYNNGRGATIGLQRDSSHAQRYSFNTASVTSGSAICYTYPKDYGDAPAGYGTPSNGGHRITDVFLGAGGDNPDIEAASQHSSNGLGDDNAGSDDENGVSFRSPANTGQSIFADVVVNNSSGANVTVCGWLDVPAGGAVDGAFDAADGQCQTTTATNPTLTFQWSGLPADQQYTTYARFRVSTDTLSTSTPATSVFNGEVEDYRIVFDFSPTLAVIDNFRVILLADSRDTIDMDLKQALPDGSLEKDLALVQWETVQEHGTLGFYVERRATGGQWKQLNSGAMLPGLISSPLGGEYVLVDPDVRRGEIYSYRLIEEDIWNGRHTYGPWTVLIGAVDHSVNPPLAQSSVKHQFGQKYVPDTSADPAQKTFFKKWQSLASGFSGRARDVKPPVVRKVTNNAFASSLAFKKISEVKKTRFNRVRLKTRDATMYQVTVDELAAVTGQRAAKISRKLLSGRWDFSTEDGGAAYYFDQESQTLYFAADKHQTIETLDNVYRLGKFRRKKGWKMDSVTGAGPVAVESGQFRDTFLFAEYKDLITWIHNDEDAGYGYLGHAFDYHNVEDPDQDRNGPFELSINLPDPVYSTDEGLIKVILRGAINQVDGDDHLARISLNDIQLPGEVRWDGMTQAILEVPFDQTILGGTESGEVVNATVKITCEALNGATISSVFVKSVEISYDRKMYAYENALRLHNTVAGPVTVSGFSNRDIKVIEAPNTPQAAWRKDLTITQSADGYQVSFVSTGGEYQLSAAPVSLVPDADYPSRLLSRRNRAEYLIIAPRSLQESAEDLSTFRSSQYQSKIIWLQDIYDVFSGGRIDSSAIEDFLRYVHSRWQQVPEYVVLFGRGTLDHPDRKGFGESLIPLRMAATPWGLIGSDNRYADVDGDYIPDFSLGRIAVSTNAAGLSYVEKLTHYAAEPVAAWTGHAAVVADDPDPEAGDFHANSDEIASLLNGYGLTTDKLYHPDDSVRDSLLANWSAGQYGFVNYDGHGGRTQLGKSSENFLKADDVATLQNGTHLPVFAALTCAVGDSSYPGTLSLGDTLTLQDNGGAIVSFVPAGLSLDSPAHRLNMAFIDALAGEGETVGKAARSALEAADTTGMVPFMFDVYGVAGDPAVTMKRLEGFRITDGPIVGDE